MPLSSSQINKLSHSIFTHHKIFVFRFICFIERFEFLFDFVFDLRSEGGYKCIAAKFRF